jgi:NADH-quinone oxidoreductase subunit C
VTPEELAGRIRPAFPDVVTARGEVTVVVERDHLLDAVEWLRDDPEVACGFLSSITATDWPQKDPRFWLVYELRSIERGHQVRLTCGLAAGDAHAPSLTGVHPTANWHEREVWDFFGIVFDGHPDLTRILLPDDWEGFPLRKDEELGGVPTWFQGARMPPIDKRGMA